MSEMAYIIKDYMMKTYVTNIVWGLWQFDKF